VPESQVDDVRNPKPNSLKTSKPRKRRKLAMSARTRKANIAPAVTTALNRLSDAFLWLVMALRGGPSAVGFSTVAIDMKKVSQC
jgi:hypothetical protein